LKKPSNSEKKSEPTTQRAKSRAQYSGIRRKGWQNCPQQNQRIMTMAQAVNK